MDDLMSAADMGKHDYDWLLTPPGTPLFSSSDTSEPQLSSVDPKSNFSARSVSSTKASRFSNSRTENNHSTRPARTSSVTRPSISSTYSSSHFSTNSNRTSVLNPSSASVTSSRPSTPGNRSTALSSTRQLAPTSHMPARSSTPSKTRSPASSTSDKTQPSHSSRPSTPTAQPQMPNSLNSNLNSNCARSTTRPPTPTHRTPVPSSKAVPARSPSVGRVLTTNGRNPAPPSRPSSPGPRVRPPTQSLVPPDFPLDVPPNLRTKLPDRPVSAGRTRPGVPLTVRANLNSEATAPAKSTRGQSSSPIVTRGRFPENSPKARLHSNGHEAISPEIQKKPAGSEGAFLKPTKPATNATTESTGFGRTISKKSLDMALRHMDICHGGGGIRGTSLFPQSIRGSTAPKGCPARMSVDPIVADVSNGIDRKDANCNGAILNNCTAAVSKNRDAKVQSPDTERVLARGSEPHLFASSRYDAILFKEDSKNMSWLHSVEDKSDQSPVFDNRFEPLPEPFSLI